MALREGPSEVTAIFADWHKSAVCAAVAMLCASPAVAQAPAPSTASVDLEQAAREAVSWHPSIVEAAARLNAQEARIGEVNADRLPQVSGGLGAGYDSTARGNWRPRANVNVSQRLFDFGKLASELDQERAGVRISEAEVLLSVDAIVRDTSYSVIEVLRGLDLLEAARDQLQSVKSISGLVDARFERGAATRSDAFQTQSRVDAAESTIQQIEAELQRWRTNLAYLLGRDEPPQVSHDLPPVLDAACQSREFDWESVPSMMEAEARFDQANATLRREQAERYPTVSVAAGASTDVPDPFGENRSDYRFGLNVTSDLFNGGATRARVQGASHAREAARAALDTARLETTRQLAEARSQVSSLQERTVTLQRRFGTMEQTRELYRLQYLELGTRTLVDLLNADQEMSQIRFDEVNSKYDLMRLGVACLYATGTLRDGLGLDGMSVEGVPL